VKVNFPLSDLELNIEDDVVAEAELLASPTLQEIEKNLWIASFDDGAETEIQVSGVRVKQFTCGCAVFKKHTVCPHIAASLLALLKKKQILMAAKVAKKAVAQKALEAPSKLTIPHILKRTDPAQLIEFIADYARNDKQFALALKTRFTADLSAGNFIDHYKTLIDNTLKAAKNPHGKLTPKGWAQFFTMLDELRQKAEGHYKNGELSKSFEILKLTMPLLHRYLRAYDAPKVKLEKRQLQFVEILRGYSQVLVSPELSEQIWDFVVQEFSNNAKYSFSIPLFDWLLVYADTKPRVDKIVQTLDNQVVATRGQFDIQDRLLTQKIQVLQKSGRVDEASTMILGSAQNPEVLFFAVQNSIDTGEFVLAKNLCQNGLNIFKNNPTVLEQIEEYLLNIAQKEFDTEGVLTYAEKRFLSSLKMEYYNLLKRYRMPIEKLKNIVQNVEHQQYRIEKRDALAAIYFTENTFTKLFELIENIQSFELLRRYGVDLWAIDKQKCIDLHKKIMYEYLYVHLGRPPAQRIRSVLEHHIERNGKDLAEAMMTQFKNDFPERYSLKEELENMIVEMEKKALRQI
jgi:predicted transposase YbfD/YdcC